MRSFLRFAMASMPLFLLACSESKGEPNSAEVTDETVKSESATIYPYQAAPSGSYDLDKGHGYILFSYDHGGYSRPELRWGDWDSTLIWDANQPENSKVEVTIHTDKIDTGVADFDAHMRNEDLFHVEKYPAITFKSTEIKKTAGNTGKITGDLTMMGVAKPVTLDVTFNKAGHETRWGVYKIGFSGHTQIKRSDWGLNYAVPYVSDEVDIRIEVEYTKAAKAE